MRNRSDATVPVPMLILGDILGAMIAWGPAAVTWTAVLLYVRAVWDTPALLLLVPVVAAAVVILSTLVIRLCLPRLKAGVYDVDSLTVKAWYFHLLLANSIHVAGLMPLVYSTYLTRWLYFRAMGAKIAFGVHLSIYTKFREFPLISIGKSSSLSAGTHISCHTYVGEKVMLGPVEIGERCFIGMDTIVGPRTKIGDGSWIGYGNRLLMDKLPADSKLEDFAWQYGNPAKRKEPTAAD